MGGNPQGLPRVHAVQGPGRYLVVAGDLGGRLARSHHCLHLVGGRGPHGSVVGAAGWSSCPPSAQSDCHEHGSDHKGSDTHAGPHSKHRGADKRGRALTVPRHCLLGRPLPTRRRGAGRWRGLATLGLVPSVLWQGASARFGVGASKGLRGSGGWGLGWGGSCGGGALHSNSNGVLGTHASHSSVGHWSRGRKDQDQA